MADSTDEFVDLELVVDAPRAAVWQAFVDPSIFAKWYPAPDWVMDSDLLSIDARVGGLARHAMVKVGDPLSATSVTARFTEVVEGERLVSTQTAFGANSTQGTEMILALDLSDADGGTRVSVHLGPLPYGVDDLTRSGWDSALERLSALLLTE